MALTNDRAEMLAQYLADKKDDSYNLLDLEASEAAAKINADGYDFTADELHEFVEMMEKAAPAEGELDENSLDNVAGGSLALTAAFGAFAITYHFYARTRRSRW